MCTTVLIIFPPHTHMLTHTHTYAHAHAHTHEVVKATDSRYEGQVAVFGVDCRKN